MNMDRFCVINFPYIHRGNMGKFIDLNIANNRNYSIKSNW